MTKVLTNKELEDIKELTTKEAGEVSRIAMTEGIPYMSAFKKYKTNQKRLV